MPRSAPVFKPKFSKTINELKRLYDKDRGNATDRGYNHQWAKVRKIKLASNPLCEQCEHNGITKIADMVHHIREISDYPAGRLELANLRSLCWQHHAEVHSK